jgi:hypothetical protein
MFASVGSDAPLTARNDPSISVRVRPAIQLVGALDRVVNASSASPGPVPAPVQALNTMDL